MPADLEFHLKIEGGPAGRAPSEYTIPVGVTTIGRVGGNRLVLEHELVSRQHAQLICTPDECQVVDQGSSNGTFVNGEKCVPGAPVVLHAGDQVRIGAFRLAFSVVEAAESVAEPAPPVIQAPPVFQAPPPPEEPPHVLDGARGEPPGGWVPPGLSVHSQRLIHYLPGIYDSSAPQMDFFSRFLGIFESILLPIEWNIDNFDLFLSPSTAPADFLPWLAGWFGVLLQPDWSEAQRREFLRQAGFIFARRGTAAALSRVLEIFAGVTPEIDDTSRDLPPFTFRVRLPQGQSGITRDQAVTLIEIYKPAHTSYLLEY